MKSWWRFVCLFVGIGAGVCFADESVLPAGDAKPALSSAYFPSRVHEFVWRNWTSLPAEKIASVIGASADDVSAIAESMGLPRDAVVEPDMRRRGYVTIIRRTWHLLPYEQLLQLLDMTPDQLSVMLREEDFLWYKLGRVKPQCEPLRYSAPDEKAKARAAEIRAVVEKNFGDALKTRGEPRFDFVRQLAAPLPGFVKPDAASAGFDLRIVYSYVAVYGDPLKNPELNPYPDGLLQRLTASGINGVWLQAVLRDLAPGGEAFPEFGDGNEVRLANLRELVARAKSFGIDVYLYLNEPRAMPHPFFEKRPEIAGSKETDLTAMCTSQPSVREWMGNALAHIFREVPGLGGVYTITASENLTNCASHGDWKSCPRCKDRGDGDIIAEVNAAIEAGVHRSAPDAKVMISDWGWRGHGDAPDIIAKMPKSVYLMSVSEWHLPIERGGVKSTVGEYSISSVGPGPRSLAHWKVATELGLKTGTEIQFNNTCEIASIPYLPVLDLVAEHCSNLEAQANLDALFIGWTMGGHPSPNLLIPQRFSKKPTPSIDTVLDEIARERFGEAGAPHARKAWKIMSDAYREYPFHISVVYTSPVQWGAANPLYPKTTGYSATMWGIPYDDVNGWRGPYPPEVLAAQFEKIAVGWRPGIEELQKAVDATPENLRAAALADLRYARASAIHFQSVANQARFVMARDALQAGVAVLPMDERARMTRHLEGIINAEIGLAKELFALTREDSRIGFEPSCQYFYLPLDLVEKVINCQWLRDAEDEWAR